MNIALNTNLQNAQFIWRITSTALIILVWGFVFSVPLTGSGVGVTALWWLAGVPALLFVVKRLFNSLITVTIWLLNTLFALDLAAQLILVDFFGAMPQPAVVVEALVNTNKAETADFLQSHWVNIIKATLGLLLFWLFAYVETKFVITRPDKRTMSLDKRWRFAEIAFVMTGFLFVGLLHTNPTMMRGHPLLRFPVYWDRFQTAQAEIKEITQKRLLYFNKLTQYIGEFDDQGTEDAQTIKVIIIGESSNRDNWSLYGYMRDTTEPLDKLVDAAPQNFQIFNSAYSTEPFTIKSLTKSLIFAVDQDEQHFVKGPDIFQVAQRYGFKTTWLSNQPKGEGWFAAIADTFDHQTFINNGNWRDSSSTDIELLPHLKKTLDATQGSPHLIVIHILGQHFFYEQRCPSEQLRYEGTIDFVSETLKNKGRSARTINARNAYDSAVYCGATFLTQVINQLTQHAKQSDTSIDLIYFSDHGQEVGHNDDISSHSAIFESGYKIPLLTWHSLPNQSAETTLDAYFELDQLPSTLMGFLNVKTPILYTPNNDLFSDAFAERAARKFR